MPQAYEYTVGWVCVLQDEYLAACHMLDERYDGRDVVNENDNNIYTLGRISEHKVVITCLPKGRTGMTAAAAVAQNMIRSFLALKFILLVGTAGGAPMPDRDIRLGDVVVSVPQGQLGGVVQYDSGKIIQGGQFERIGHLNSPPTILLGLLQDMQRRYNDPRKPDKIQEHIKRMDYKPGFRRPTEDRLYRADYEHQGGKTCSNCIAAKLEQRPPRVSDRVINVHYGTIGSANSVMKNPQQRDRLARDPNLKILCFDMEAAGLMNTVPTLVIRGICNYADSHKNDEWNKYAAVTAAAYTKELLTILEPEEEAMPFRGGGNPKSNI
ncbi:purine and uridine phosphorylase [Daldinia caldariorum]|uniref:purine and uridine phosphorylase n=1 Tax=Daldinia caldariorum TaxID=326644 RepID=UPI002007992F|nr:purine and uridine phosphorylase [Daldinia caldariorum]KAI1466104.1 purine and uridine phosphorylase [Daldinia caldariorum]